MKGYGRCPRCGTLGMEYLETHSYCWECNYFPEDDLNWDGKEPLHSGNHEDAEQRPNKDQDFEQFLKNDLSDDDLDDYYRSTQSDQEEKS